MYPMDFALTGALSWTVMVLPVALPEVMGAADRSSSSHALQSSFQIMGWSNSSATSSCFDEVKKARLRFGAVRILVRSRP